jgi:hypothetical protein
MRDEVLGSMVLVTDPAPRAQPKGIGCVQRIVSRERIRLTGFGDVRVDAQELRRARVVVAVD